VAGDRKIRASHQGRARESSDASARSVEQRSIRHPEAAANAALEG
jgi:hypothetical protein